MDGGSNPPSSTKPLKSQPATVGFFLPTTACLRGFLRVLVDFGVSQFCQQPAVFTLRLHILSQTLPTQCLSNWLAMSSWQAINFA